MSVITLNVDLDDCKLARARCVLIAARALGVDASLYRTRAGYHVCVNLDKPMDIRRSLFYRLYLGDDVGRVAIDREALGADDMRAFDRLFEGRVKGGVAFERVLVR